MLSEKKRTGTIMKKNWDNYAAWKRTGTIMLSEKGTIMLPEKELGQ